MNTICIDKVASTILSILGVKASAEMAEPIAEVIESAKGTDRVFMYNPDAIAEYIHDRYAEIFAPLESDIDLKLKMLSVVPPVTPVCFGSMYSGLKPSVHGIMKYEKPVLKCETVFDILAQAGKKVAIVSTANDSISMIFLERDIEYYIYKTKEECNKKAIELIKENRHDLIVLYNGDYDHYMHRVTPTGKRAVRALRENIETFCEIREEIKKEWTGHRTALCFAPDHGCHRIYGILGGHGIEKECDMDILHFWKFI